MSEFHTSAKVAFTFRCISTFDLTRLKNLNKKDFFWPGRGPEEIEAGRGPNSDKDRSLQINPTFF